MQFEKPKEYYDSLDKRTKEYKEWKTKFEKHQATLSKGLGDTVEKITKATGIKAIVEAFTPDGKDCGCNKRKEALNRMFPNYQPKCLEELEFNFLATWYSKRRTSVNKNDRVMFYDIYNRVFGTALEASNCPSCLNTIIKKLKAIFNEYK